MQEVNFVIIVFSFTAVGYLASKALEKSLAAFRAGDAEVAASAAAQERVEKSPFDEVSPPPALSSSEPELC